MPVSKDLEKTCLKNYLIRCCYHYYVLAEPLIGDCEFDMEFKRLRKLEKETDGADNNSPTQMIWGDCVAQYSEQIEAWEQEPEWIK